MIGGGVEDEKGDNGSRDATIAVTGVAAGKIIRFDARGAEV